MLHSAKIRADSFSVSCQKEFTPQEKSRYDYEAPQISHLDTLCLKIYVCWIWNYAQWFWCEPASGCCVLGWSFLYLNDLCLKRFKITDFNEEMLSANDWNFYNSLRLFPFCSSQHSPLVTKEILKLPAKLKITM